MLKKVPAAAVALLLLVPETVPAQTKKVAPAVPPELNLGKAIYLKNCAVCHGVDVKGTKNGPPLIHKIYHPGHHADGAFYLAVKVGVRQHHWKFGSMPPVKGVDQNMTTAIIKFIRHLQKEAGIF
jgi:cytochrome c5